MEMRKEASDEKKGDVRSLVLPSPCERFFIAFFYDYKRIEFATIMILSLIFLTGGNGGDDGGERTRAGVVGHAPRQSRHALFRLAEKYSDIYVFLMA